MTGKEYVEQIKKLDTLIKNKRIEKQMKKQQYFDIALSVGLSSQSVTIVNKQGKSELHNVEKVQSSSNGEKMANAINNGVDIERKIEQQIIELEAKKQSIIENIEKLSEPEYDILHIVYVQFLTLDDVARKRNMSKRWATSMHGIALKNIEKISNCVNLR